MSKSPLVSVLMPAYNAEDYIEEAIESILSQNFKDFELLIIDDASTDKTPDIINRYKNRDSRVKVLSNKKNLYIGRALNKGLKCASSNIIARMDADDISLPDRLELQYEKIIDNPGLSVVGGDIRIINNEGRSISIRRYPTDSKGLKRMLFRYSPFAHPVTMFRKDLVLGVGGYNPAKSPSEDLDLWIKLGQEYDFASIPKVLLKYRFFPDSHSNRKLRKVELMTIRMRIDAMYKYGYKPSLYDIVYNIFQFLTLWIMPASIRIKLFEFIRNA